mgnify:CR=1 FL=1
MILTKIDDSSAILLTIVFVISFKWINICFNPT